MTFDARAWLAQWPVTRPFGDLSMPQFGRHTGCDLGIPAGTVIPALVDGVVVLDDDDATFASQNPATWSGIALAYVSTDGVEILVAHLSANYASQGEAVATGDPVGSCGATGAATGPHVHLEVRINGELVDPLIHFAQEDDMALTEERIREIAKEETRAVLSSEAWLRDAIAQAVRNAVDIAVGQTITRISNAIQQALKG